MQRQSLGSPGSNHHHHPLGGVTAVNSLLTTATETPHDSKRLSSTITATTATTTSSLGFTDDEKTKLLKPSTLPSKKRRPEKIIHGIPILTFVCFLILYLSSHDPSQSEMDAFGGFKKRLETTTTTTALLADSGVMEIGNGGVVVAVGNRGRRDLRAAKIRVHRKLGDF